MSDRSSSQGHGFVIVTSSGCILGLDLDLGSDLAL